MVGQQRLDDLAETGFLKNSLDLGFLDQLFTDVKGQFLFHGGIIRRYVTASSGFFRNGGNMFPLFSSGPWFEAQLFSQYPLRA
jgi:hypothetical protein